MSSSKGQKDREWNARKKSQNPHGKVNSFDELARESKKNNKKQD